MTSGTRLIGQVLRVRGDLIEVLFASGKVLAATDVPVEAGQLAVFKVLAPLGTTPVLKLLKTLSKREVLELAHLEPELYAKLTKPLAPGDGTRKGKIDETI